MGMTSYITDGVFVDFCEPMILHMNELQAFDGRSRAAQVHVPKNALITISTTWLNPGS